MLLSETSLQASAAVALSDAIESMSPSAAVLESQGFAFQAAAYLCAVIAKGDPDLNELRSHGLSQETAVSIAEAISKRHARKAAALASVPKPAPKSAPTVPDALEPGAAMSQLHDLMLEIERTRPADITVLIRAGWSEATAREIVKVANAAKRGVH